MKHKLVVLVENNTGVLSRICGLFSRRGYNIESIVAGDSEEPSISRLTIVVPGDEVTIEQVTKQLNKIIDIVKVEDITNKDIVERQLLMVRVSCNSQNRADIKTLMDIFHARIIDVGYHSMIIEATGDENRIDAIIKTLDPFGIQEVLRTGVSAMERSSKDD